MEPILKKIVYASIGAFSLTKDKVEELVDELVKRGEVTHEEKSKVIKETMSRIEERSKQAKVWIEDAVNVAAEKMKPQFQKDIVKLQEEVELLQRQMAKLKKEMTELKNR